MGQEVKCTKEVQLGERTLTRAPATISIIDITPLSSFSNKAIGLSDFIL
jgi:hypothetical protein